MTDIAKLAEKPLRAIHAMLRFAALVLGRKNDFREINFFV